ncbi:MAG TPA: Stp1/IreP family PP2C-type Ser/Thr phosphatase [Vicinamibacterales bacterium]|jgi:protein phosphatase|nr:Stp1/IreP family PP2C-type Ser/Thr phosphatase [Vicinamibacterales bacterium]
MQLRVGAATDIGRVRVHNEDAYASLEEHGLFVVCDGMGGEAAGEVASQMAIDTIVDELKNGSRETPPDPDGFRTQTTRLGAAVRRSNYSIYDAAQKDARQARMGTTVVGAWIAEDIVSLAHVGDSRAYLWQRGHLEPLTSDHSLVEMQVKAGILTRESALQHQDQNILLRALGREPDVDVELNEVPVQAGDYVLLCSDGLTRMVPEPDMSSTIADIRDPQEICEELIAAANRNGGADNVTVVVVEVVGGWWSEFVNRVKRSLRWRR